MKKSEVIELSCVRSHWPMQLVKSNAENTIKAAFEFCEKENILVRWKTEDDLNPTFGTAGPMWISLPIRSNWEKRSKVSRACLILHEVAHVLDSKMVKYLKWGIRYIFVLDYTLITELRSYIFDYLAQCLLESTNPLESTRLDREAQRVADSFWTNYVKIKFFASKPRIESICKEAFHRCIDEAVDELFAAPSTVSPGRY